MYSVICSGIHFNLPNTGYLHNTYLLLLLLPSTMHALSCSIFCFTFNHFVNSAAKLPLQCFRFDVFPEDNLTRAGIGDQTNQREAERDIWR